jgi:hypothetical protein
VHTQTGLFTRNRTTRSLTVSQELYVKDLFGRHVSLIDGLTKRFDSPADPTVSLSPEQSPETGSSECGNACNATVPTTWPWLAPIPLAGERLTSRVVLHHTSQLARLIRVESRCYSLYSAAIRVLLYLQGSASRALHFQPDSTRPFRVFVDSNWATKFSVPGAVLEVMGCNVHWFSKTQRSVSLSSTEAGWFAAMVAAREGMYISATSSTNLACRYWVRLPFARITSRCENCRSTLSLSRRLSIFFVLPTSYAISATAFTSALYRSRAHRIRPISSLKFTTSLPFVPMSRSSIVYVRSLNDHLRIIYLRLADDSAYE